MQRTSKRSPLIGMQIGFLKKLVRTRYNNRIPQDDAIGLVIIHQFLIRIKMDARADAFPDHGLSQGRKYLRRWAPWFDIHSFPWQTRDNVHYLDGTTLGHAIALSWREWYGCKPKRGSAGIRPAAPVDIEVKQWLLHDRTESAIRSADKQAKKKRAERAIIRRAVESDVEKFLAQDRTLWDIAEIFNSHRREHPSLGEIDTWTPRMVCGFDKGRNSPERKQERAAERYVQRRSQARGIESDETTGSRSNPPRNGREDSGNV